MNQNTIQIKPMVDYCHDISKEVVSIFVAAYYDELKTISKSKDKLEQAFITAIQKEFFYIAERNREIVGILACTTNKKRALVINKSTFQKNLGFFKGFLYYLLLKEEFNKDLPYPNEVGYIECVATTPSARGKGVATTLLHYVLTNLPIKHYLLEVVDTNKSAIRIYEKAGFKETHRKKTNFPKLKGFNEKIYMELLK
ncbi:MAG: GNAT family N-acetyltransferase [Bacilli bacterium]|nr:GNAT family N-acetyltransferase [Bacilli bacterium]